jgi:hypothetical protein
MSRASHPDVQRAAALVAAALTALSLVTVATRLLATVGVGRGINSALGYRHRSLSLNLLWNSLGGVLGQGHGHNWGRKRGYLHNATRLTSTTIKRFSHGRSENPVNCTEVNVILSKNAEIGSLQGISMEQVQS